MSLLEEQTAAANTIRKKDNRHAALEHMAELEAKRIESEAAMKSTVKANWERLIEKRKSKVLHRLLPVRLQ